ncbi:Translocon-associated protein subunit alpha like [Actinidia chinensis var. chinensis]|uniref:Translocon-associated protein subunit alpha n=1 Tax=Actinidia chinensis var. chinensis TaxID=1590841 RepID=A0A2R6RW92_ACTCC|nr:Translocon-associated protein subunit alpha like [Actinidia chinensis var. chinensis]
MEMVFMSHPRKGTVASMVNVLGKYVGVKNVQQEKDRLDVTSDIKAKLSLSFSLPSVQPPSPSSDKNKQRLYIMELVAKGGEYMLCGITSTGESSVNVIAIKASVHLPYDHHLLLQNLTAQAFNNASVPPSAQGTFPYIFAVSKFLQSGTYDLVGTIVYEIEENPYQSTFYNGTIEVAEASGPLSVESVFLFFLGIALVGFFGIWIRNQIQHLSKVSTHHHPCTPNYAIEHF